VYPSTPQPIRAFSASSDGDLLALSPQNLTTVTILRISQRQAIYYLDTSQISLTPLIGLSFVPGGRNALMTAHSGGHATFWDLTRLSENPESIRLLDPQVSLRDDGHRINATGKVILLNRMTSKGCAPLLLRTEETNFSAIATTIRFSRSNRCPQAIAVADDGHFLTIGKYLYSLGLKNKRKKISLPDKSHVVTSTISPNSKLALAVLLPTLQSQVRVLNWSTRMGDWTAPSEVLNIWGLAFSKDEERLAVGVQLRSDGLDKFAICVLAKVNKGLQEITRTLEWESMKPIRMSFTRNGKLVVLVADRDREILSWSTLTFKLPPNSEEVEVPLIIDFTPNQKVVPDMTSEGDVFYLGTGTEDGWVMRLGVEKEEAEKAVWCPSSWWSIGSLSILTARKGKTSTIIFVNTIMGIAAVKLQLPE
jgi:WD40 repeat protein